MKKVNDIGFYDSGTGKHQSNTVYRGGCIPTITTITGGGYTADKGIKKMAKKKINVVGDLSPQKPHLWSRVIRGGVNTRKTQGSLNGLVRW